MNWTDRALVLGCRSLGESGVVLEVLTREHGRHLGLVHGGRSRRLQPVLQAGNGVVASWRARLDEQLGSFTVEAEALRAARLIGSAAALFGVGALTAHLRLLPERDPHPDLFGAAEEVLDRLDGPEAGATMVRFELMLLADLGFGLDLSACAVTGRRDDLAYVSPKSGRAVSRESAAPYRDRLLPLPAFLLDESAGPPEPEALGDAIRLTGHFLEAHLYGPRGATLPDERARFVALAAPATARPASVRFG